MFNCPLNTGISASPIGSTEDIITFSQTSYAYNAWGVGLSTDRMGLGGYSLPNDFRQVTVEATKDSAVQQPAAMVAIGDGFLRLDDPKYDGAQSISAALGPHKNHGGLASRTPYKLQTSFRNHHGKFNYGFCEGHVEVEDMNKQFFPTDENMRRWNRDHEPHRERWWP